MTKFDKNMKKYTKKVRLLEERPCTNGFIHQDSLPATTTNIEQKKKCKSKECYKNLQNLVSATKFDILDNFSHPKQI